MLARPWTVDRLRAEYERTSSLGPEATGSGVDPILPDRRDEEVRSALIFLLGASRNEEVLPLVGAALADDQLEVRVLATEVILGYWHGVFVGGGTEQAMEAAAAWWAAHR